MSKKMDMLRAKIKITKIEILMRNAQFSCGYQGAIKSSVGPGGSTDGGPMSEPVEALTILSLGRPFKRQIVFFKPLLTKAI